MKEIFAEMLILQGPAKMSRTLAGSHWTLYDLTGSYRILEDSLYDPKNRIGYVYVKIFL